MFSSTQAFQLWDFNPTHSQLLLRSASKLYGPRNNLDIVFKVVTYLAIPQSFDTLSIEIGSSADLAGYPDALANLQKFNKVFVIKTKTYKHFVIASSFYVEENELPMMKSSIDNDFHLPNDQWHKGKIIYQSAQDLSSI